MIYIIAYAMDQSFLDLKAKLTEVLEFVDTVKSSTEDELEALVDESIKETMDDLQSRNQEELSRLTAENAALKKAQKAHSEEIARITQEQLDKLDELTSQHAQELKDLEASHEKHLDQHKTHLTDFTLVQELSSQISDLQRKLELANRKIARLEGGAEPEEKPDKKKPKLKIQLHKKEEEEETGGDEEASGEEEASGDEEPPSPDSPDTPDASKEARSEPEPEPKQEESEDDNSSRASSQRRVFGKIKLRGTIYLLDKTDTDVDQLIYEYVNGKPGEIVGKKTVDGKYRLNKK
jgi:phage-related minor tail protein